MLFHHASILAAGLVFAIPYLDDCDCQYDPGGEVPGEDDPGTECEPDEGESECRSCLRISCCDGMAACESDFACDCVVDCMSDSSVGLEECARSRCDVLDLTAALEPMNRICAIDESCVEPRICRSAPELPRTP